MGKNYIIGASEQGSIAFNILKIMGETVEGFFDNDDSKNEFLGVPIMGKSGDLEKILNKEDKFLVAIGNGRIREKITEDYKDKFLQFSAIHPSAIIMPNVKLGIGITINPGVIIMNGANIRDGVILNTGCIVEHDNDIGKYSQICPGVTLGGKVTIGRGCYIGMGTTVRDHIQIGPYTLVGTGSNVTKDILKNVVAYGNPARVIRDN